MIALKKLYGEELLRLALMLSLLRAGPDHYLRDEARILAGGLVNGTDFAPEIDSVHTRTRFLHPKSLDSILMDYERDVFEELNNLGRWSNSRAARESVQAYLLNGVENNNLAPADLDSSDSLQHLNGSQLENEEVEQVVTVKTEEQSEDEEDTHRNHATTTVTLSASFIRNLTSFHGPLLEEDSAQSMPFDVSQFFTNPTLIKQEVNEETDTKNDFQDDNAIDYASLYMRGGDSITDQNLADLSDFAETAESLEEYKRSIQRLDVRDGQEDLERFLIENTDLELEEASCVVKRERASTSFTSVGGSSGIGDDVYASSSCSNETLIKDIKSEKDEGLYSGDELTQEDMDLIEVLWKQDVDMGFCLDKPPASVDSTKCVLPDAVSSAYGDDDGGDRAASERDEIDRLKDELKKECEAGAGATAKSFTEEEAPDAREDPWAGLNYTVDTETGEYVLSADSGSQLNNLLEEALQLVGIEDTPELEELKTPQSEEMLAGRYGPGGGHPHPHHHHHHHLYHHQNLVRSMSMEQRWQDLATLLALPAAQQHHYQQHDLYQQPRPITDDMSPGYVVPPYAPLPSEKPPLPPNADLYGAGANLGNAVAASMNIPHGAPPPSLPPQSPHPALPHPQPHPFYKAEHGQPHEQEQLYYQNTTADLNGTQDGFLSSILNDDDLQLMDMAVNEGMYTMRMLEGSGQHQQVQQPLLHHHQQSHIPPHQLSMGVGSERIDASSDSAVSSMGSERVPSLSDSEWCDGGSDSAQDYHGKMRPCEDSQQQPLVAQKKHHMFGKRCFQETPSGLARPRMLCPSEPPTMPPVGGPMPHKFDYELHHPPAPVHANGYSPDVGHITPEMKYSCTMEFSSGMSAGARHNHTYSLPPAPLPAAPRPLVRDKRGRRGLDGPAGSCSSGPLSRDEKRARALGVAGIPMSVHDIINLPMDEFNERLSKHDLSETQLSLIRDIRRRGKNKVAAQNCRKRKLDQITSLADEVRDVRSRKQRLQRDHQLLSSERQRTKEHFASLYRHVFQHLRDSEGNPLSSSQYSLQQAADGAVVLVPRAPASRAADRHMSGGNGTSEDELERIKIKQRKSFDQ